LIEDTDTFIASVLASLDKQIPEAQNPEQAKKEINARRKKLLGKKDRYQEMYANDLISMAELKDKLASITDELKSVDMDLAQIAQSAQIISNATEIAQYYRQEIARFLELETITNMDMRRILDHISVDKDGHVRVVLKKFEDMT
jgi:seryl-tRNA synthetase